MPERQEGQVEQRVTAGGLRPVDDAGHLLALDEHMAGLEVAVDEDRGPRAERGLRDPAVAGDQIAGQHIVGHQPRAFDVEGRRQVVGAPAGPGRQRRVVQGPDRRTRRLPRRRGGGGRPAQAAERPAREGGDREHGWPVPEHLGRRDGRQRHRPGLDPGARPVGVHLQEHVADAQGRPLGMGDDDLDLVHGGLVHGGQYPGAATGPPGISPGSPPSGADAPGRQGREPARSADTSRAARAPEASAPCSEAVARWSPHT